MSTDSRWIVNLSLLFTELPLLERPRAAADAGFDAVEYWWPFGDSGTPSDADVDAFVHAIEDAGVQLYAMNLFAGDMPVGERGVLSYPERIEEFRHSVGIAARIGERLGTRFFNAPYGHRRAGLDHDEQDALARESLAFAADALGAFGGTVLLEPLSGMPDYPLKRSQEAFDVISQVPADNLGYLLDTFHALSVGEDLATIVREHPGSVAHVQIADVPGRGEPGSGASADRIREMIAALSQTGYSGTLALEYFPTASTVDSLATWRAEFSS